jgi:hypothetical protein
MALVLPNRSRKKSHGRAGAKLLSLVWPARIRHKAAMDYEDPLTTAKGIALGVPAGLAIWYWLLVYLF